MKVTNNQIAAANRVLQMIAPNIGDTVVRFRIIQAGKAFAPHLESWDEARKIIINQYAEMGKDDKPKEDKNGFVIFREDDKTAALEAITELGNATTDLTLTPIKLTRLAAALTEPLEYGAIQAIDWLIEDDTD